MKFTRINETTVNCIITEDDLYEQGLSLEDFIGQTESAVEFIHEIVEKAAHEVDYKPNGGVMPIQVAVLPDKSVSVTLSENPKSAVADMLRGLADRLQNFLEDVQKKSANDNDGELPNVEIVEDREKALVPHMAKGSHVDAQIDDQGVTNRRLPLWKEALDATELVFVFRNMQDLDALSGVYSKIGIGVEASALYKDATNGQYYLFVKPDSHKDAFSKVFNHATEYGRFLSADERFLLHLRESAQPILEEQALNVLAGFQK